MSKNSLYLMNFNNHAILSHQYYSLKKRTYKLKLNEVAFEGGLDALRETIYAHLKYEHEDNIRIIVFILFDRKLHIDEVRLCELVPNHVHISSHRMRSEIGRASCRERV